MSALENLLVAQHNRLMRASGYTAFGLFGLPVYRHAQAHAVERARYWLDRVGITARADDNAGTLPYGDQRRLEVVRAMCTEPVLLCLDEPAAGLNNRESAELNELLLFIRDEHKIGVLLIEHDMNVVMKISDYIVVLDHGRRISVGTPEAGPQRPGGDPRLSWRGGGRGAAGGGGARSRRAGHSAAGSPMMLAVSGVHTFYGHVEALKGVDLEVKEGEIVTLIGANGAGKSTLLMTVCGTPQAQRGRVMFEGRDITREPTHVIMRNGIAQVPEGRRIFPRMTLLENLQMGALVNKPEYFAEDVDRVFAIFPILKDRQDQRGGTLSGGEQQMLAIGRALMSRPRLLLLDEPSLGLAPMVVRQIFQVIREINRKFGTTVLLVEQNAFHALRLADRGYVLANGVILMSGTGAELLANREVRAAYLEGGH